MLYFIKNTRGFHMRYHFFLYYGWFFQNLRKYFIQTNMHTTATKLLLNSKKSLIAPYTVYWVYSDNVVGKSGEIKFSGEALWGSSKNWSKTTKNIVHSAKCLFFYKIQPISSQKCKNIPEKFSYLAGIKEFLISPDCCKKYAQKSSFVGKNTRSSWFALLQQLVNLQNIPLAYFHG